MVLQLQVSNIVCRSDSLDVGDIASAVGKIPDSKTMLAGSSYTITVEATAGGTVTIVTATGISTTVGGATTFQTAVVHVTRI